MELCAVTTYNPTPAMYVVNRESPLNVRSKPKLERKQKNCKNDLPLYSFCIEFLIGYK